MRNDVIKNEILFLDLIVIHYLCIVIHGLNAMPCEHL